MCIARSHDLVDAWLCWLLSSANSARDRPNNHYGDGTGSDMAFGIPRQLSACPHWLARRIHSHVAPFAQCAHRCGTEVYVHFVKEPRIALAGYIYICMGVSQQIPQSLVISAT